MSAADIVVVVAAVVALGGLGLFFFGPIAPPSGRQDHRPSGCQQRSTGS